MPHMMDNPQGQVPVVEGGPWGTILLLLSRIAVLAAIILQYMELGLYK